MTQERLPVMKKDLPLFDKPTSLLLRKKKMQRQNKQVEVPHNVSRPGLFYLELQLKDSLEN